MKNTFNINAPLAKDSPSYDDYIGDDGLLYCGTCRSPKEAYYPTEMQSLLGRDRHPIECTCQITLREEQESAEKLKKHHELVSNIGYILWGNVGAGVENHYFAVFGEMPEE